MIFSLDVRRAGKGDCLLLHYGTKDKPGLVLIDGGPADVYASHLKPRLEKIRAERQLDNKTSLAVDLLMVSHVDDDHIHGILDLTREMLDAVPPRSVRIVKFWHNSFDDVIGKNPQELTAAVHTQWGTAALDGGLPVGATLEPDDDADDDEDEEVAVGTLKVLASIEQGHRLRGDAKKLGFPPNKKLIMAARDPQTIAEGLTFIVAGPMQPELLALQKKHDEWLEKQKEKKKTGAAALAAYVDKSVPNLSSIVVLAKSGNKSMLLTGDARGDKILKGLEMVGVLEKNADAKMHVNILKVPHHGSARNLGPDFFQRVTADHYVFSGNGEHGNPEREAMQMLFDARGADAFEIYLTYPLDEIDPAREKDWKKEQKNEVRRKEQRLAEGKAVKKEPRGDWSHEHESLSTFFEQNPLANGQKLHIVDAKKACVIDLLTPLGY